MPPRAVLLGLKKPMEVRRRPGHSDGRGPPAHMSRARREVRRIRLGHIVHPHDRLSVETPPGDHPSPLLLPLPPSPARDQLVLQQGRDCLVILIQFVEEVLEGVRELWKALNRWERHHGDDGARRAHLAVDTVLMYTRLARRQRRAHPPHTLLRVSIGKCIHASNKI